MTGWAGDTLVRNPRQTTMRCAYCGVEKPWTTPSYLPRPNAVLRLQGGDGEFPNRLYAQCWTCWERDHLRSAMAWAKRSWWQRRKAWR